MENSIQEVETDCILDLDSIVKLALVKAFPKARQDEIRDEVKAGRYLLETTVTFKGALLVGDDHKSTSPASLCPWALVKLALSKMNSTTQDAIILEAIEAYREKRDVNSDDVKKAVADKCAMLLKETESNTRGSVRYVGDVSFTNSKARRTVEEVQPAKKKKK